MNYFRELATVAQNAYGGYCNYVREADLEPIPYHVFCEEYPRTIPLSKKKRKQELIEFTKQYRSD